MRASAEAPCKAIITGEHFVVHGAWALAAAIDRRVRVDVSDSDRLRVESERFRPGHVALRPLASVTEAMAREFSFRPNMKVEVSSSVPDGAGLGSSAATMVSLVSAISRLKGLGLGAGEVEKAAMLGEKEVHGRPSGVDVSVCARGGVELFRTGERPRALRFGGARRLVVVFSGRKRSTKALIGRVSAAKAKNPALFGGLAESASDVSRLAAERLVKGDMDGLGRLLTFNHAVLSSVGASDPHLDGLVDSLLALGCAGAKLTGAGGGGSVIAVPPRGKEKSTIRELRERGLDAFGTRMPVAGVRSWLGR